MPEKSPLSLDPDKPCNLFELRLEVHPDPAVVQALVEELPPLNLIENDDI